MSTSHEIRNIRLENDHKAMCNILGPIIQWRAVKGTPPFVEAYELTVNIRSIISSTPDYRDQHVIRIEIPGDYPKSPPLAVMISDPVVFHPNWFAHNKKYCPGSWAFSEGLGDHVIRMLQTLQYDPDVTDEDDAANKAAAYWYVTNRNRGLFPCDTQKLPSPLKIKIFAIQTANKTTKTAKTFYIQRHTKI
jgi:ubiquitin-protein ligase